MYIYMYNRFKRTKTNPNHSHKPTVYANVSPHDTIQSSRRASQSSRRASATIQIANTSPQIANTSPQIANQLSNQPTILSDDIHMLTSNDARYDQSDSQSYVVPIHLDPIHLDPSYVDPSYVVPNDLDRRVDQNKTIQRNVDQLANRVDDMRVDIKKLDDRIDKLVEQIAKQITQQIAQQTEQIAQHNAQQISQQIAQQIAQQNAKSNQAPVRGKVNVAIDNLHTNASFCMDNVCGVTTVYGDYAHQCIRVDELKGQIRVAIDIRDTMCIYGTISIYNHENGTVFSGMIYHMAGALHYVLSNRPLVQLGSGFKGIISLMIKMAT